MVEQGVVEVEQFEGQHLPAQLELCAQMSAFATEFGMAEAAAAPMPVAMIASAEAGDALVVAGKGCPAEPAGAVVQLG